MKILMLIILLIFFAQYTQAEAYCSLRDPTAQITELFPNKTNQLSIVKEINDQTRNQVKMALPRNDLHFNELGKHTLYVVMAEEKSLGYVHVRSEQSQWGLIEIVWALDKELRIINFAFQRCRSPKKQIVNDKLFKNMFIGKGYSALKKLLSSDGVSANQQLLNSAKDAPDLANAVLRCALKTLLITDILWGEDLQKFRDS